jgi:predicted CDP-diglyceride synthetase/phosphatidate cytidylyltransferase
VEDWVARIKPIDAALVLALSVTVLLALPMARRGGRFRTLPGWVAFCAVFAVLLIGLDHAPPWAGFVLLGGLMFVALRGYFFVAPVRPRDRYAILACYLSIPFALYPAWLGSEATFLATVPIALFLLIPVFLAIGRAEEGMLDSMGRTLLGVLFFVFCTAHLGLLLEVEPQAAAGAPLDGLPQLFGVLVLAAELPRRLAGNFHSGTGWAQASVAVLLGAAPAGGLGWWLGPMCGLVEEDAARAGGLVALAVTLGALVSSAVAKDLELTTTSALVGRGALLNRVVPAVYAAPVYFHYLNHFA